MMPEAFDENQLADTLRGAFALACLELGLEDEVGRDRLAQLMVSLAESGEHDPEVIRAHAVHRMQPPAAGLFHAI